MNGLVERALNNKRESKYIDFKSEFNPNSRQAWCELIKDLVAMANSGGGAIAFGLDNKGQPTGTDLSALLDTDPAQITDKVASYTSTQFHGFQLFEAEKLNATVPILVINSVDVPLVFTRPGTYPTSDGGQRTAFSRGTVYFRHGAKSEPALPEDLSGFISARIESARKEWMTRVRRVVHAPPGYQVRVLPQDVRESRSRDATPIRIVEDENAPGYRRIDPDITHPFRQTELIQEVNRRLPRDSEINPYDILAVRRVHGIEELPEFYHQPKFGSAQYSVAFAEWLVDQLNDDPHFFKKARDRLYKMRHGNA
jgi:hypothetical protein